MKTAEPKIIYLQIGEDNDVSEFGKKDFENNGITWCWDEIYDSDIKYISKSYLMDLIDEMMENSKKRYPAFNGGNLPDKLYEVAYCKALTELKQKIEEIN